MRARSRLPDKDVRAFPDGHRIIVYGNAQDGVGNTMDSGEVIVHGRAGDVVAMCMRGGRIFIRGNVGYRCAIHMKGVRRQSTGYRCSLSPRPESGRQAAQSEVHRHRNARWTIYIRGKVEKWQFGREVDVVEVEEDYKLLEKHVGEFCREFGYDADEVLGAKFTKLKPVTHRPYGRIYAY